MSECNTSLSDMRLWPSLQLETESQQVLLRGFPEHHCSIDLEPIIQLI